MLGIWDLGLGLKTSGRDLRFRALSFACETGYPNSRIWDSADPNTLLLCPLSLGYIYVVYIVNLVCIICMCIYVCIHMYRKTLFLFWGGVDYLTSAFTTKFFIHSPTRGFACTSYSNYVVPRPGLRKHP